jgi:hypothetical protein
MRKERDDERIAELDLLRAPERSGRDRLAFRQRIRAAAKPLLARRRRPTTSWEFLAAWARPGLVAASVGALLILGALQLRGSGEPGPAGATDAEVLAAAERGQLPTLLVARNAPDANALLAAALLNGNGGASPQPAAPPER